MTLSLLQMRLSMMIQFSSRLSQAPRSLFVSSLPGLFVQESLHVVIFYACFSVTIFYQLINTCFFLNGWIHAWIGMNGLLAP